MPGNLVSNGGSGGGALTLCARNLESLKILHLGLFSLSSLATIPFDPYIKA
jgi:hypothetical protein